MVPLFASKNKYVRFRIVQICTSILSTSPAVLLSSRYFQRHHQNLINRVRDKEAPIRVQACIALIKILSPTTRDTDPKQPHSAKRSYPQIDTDETLELLIDALTYDTSPEVRRAIVNHLDPGKYDGQNMASEVIEALLLRARDSDTATRKLIWQGAPVAQYLAKLPNTQRMPLLVAGLKDRETSVASAVRFNISNWMTIRDMATLIQVSQGSCLAMVD